MRLMHSYGLYFAWVVALFGTLLSLYFGEFLGMTPCRLCWLQRVALFPLALQLGIGAYYSDLSIKKYAYPLLGYGFLVAIIQGILPWFPLHALCGANLDCQEKAVSLFGEIPFPWVSACGFLAMSFLLWMQE